MTNVNMAMARENMIKQQFRTWDVLDERVLQLIDEVPREDFVPPAYQHLAYADYAIPIGHGHVMMPPIIEARLLQLLDIQNMETVLEVGTGSGYLTALMARLASHVVSVDIHPDFTEAAAARLSGMGVTNITLETGNAASGWGKQAPYDVIVVTGSLPVLSEDFQYSLRVGGRLFAVIGEGHVMEAILITRVGDNEWTHEALFETSLPALESAPEPSRFTL